jgi:hypothetical protein
MLQFNYSYRDIAYLAFSGLVAHIRGKLECREFLDVNHITIKIVFSDGS